MIFIGIIGYIYLSYSANIPKFVEEVRKEDIRSKAFQLSEILVNDPGQPKNWNEGGTIKRIGLMDQNSNRQNLISKKKVEKLDTDFDCDTDYDELQDKLAMNRTFSLIIFNITDDGKREPIYTCTPPSVVGTINAKIIRIVVLNDSGTLSPAEVIIQM